MDLTLTTILEVLPETIGDDQEKLYHELGLTIQALARKQVQPLENLLRQSAKMLMQRNEFYKHRQLLEMMSSYAVELRPSLEPHDWKTHVRVNDNVMLSMETGPANIPNTGLEIATRQERYAMHMWSAFSDRALKIVRRRKRYAMQTEQRRIAIRLRVQQTVQRFKSHAQQLRLTLAAEMHVSLDTFVVVSSGDHAHDISAIKMALDDAVAIEWAIRNSRLLQSQHADEGAKQYVNDKHKRSRINYATVAHDVGRMLIDAAASKNKDATTTVNLWIDALKVRVGREHAIFKCMQEAYITGTEDAYARLCARIWPTRYSRKKAKYKLGSSSHACSILLDILENDANCR